MKLRTTTKGKIKLSLNFTITHLRSFKIVLHLLILTCLTNSCSTTTNPQFQGPFMPEKLSERLLYHTRCEKISTVKTEIERTGLIGEILYGQYIVTCPKKEMFCTLEAKAFSDQYTVVCYGR